MVGEVWKDRRTFFSTRVVGRTGVGAESDTRLKGLLDWGGAVEGIQMRGGAAGLTGHES